MGKTDRTARRLAARVFETCKYDRRTTDLQEGRLLQHADELGEVVPDLFVDGPDQADLTHRPGTVGSLGIRPLHLQEGSQREQIRDRNIPVS